MRNPAPVVFLLLCGALAAQVEFKPLKTIDLAPLFVKNSPSQIGTHASCVAWNGSRLFVGGWTETGGQVSWVEVFSPLGSAPSFSNVAGQFAVAPFRGFAAIDVDGSSLAISLDSGSISFEGLSGWDVNGTFRWKKRLNGSAGSAFDPGFPGGNPAVGSGVAWTQLGERRRALANPTTGADIQTLTTGMEIVPPSNETLWQAMDFDEVTGDVFLRNGNDVLWGHRSGDNTLSSVDWVFDAPASFAPLHRLAYIETAVGRVVIFNDRQTGLPGQKRDDVVKAYRPNGVPETIDWGGHQAPDSTGIYDFSYDRLTETLAFLDYTDGRVTIFSVTLSPFSPYGEGCPGTAGIIPRFSARGTGKTGTTLTLQISNGVGGGLAWILFGAKRGALTTALTGPCEILVDPIFPTTLGPITLSGVGGGAGSGQVSFLLPLGIGGARATTQAFVSDPGAIWPLPFVFTNGVELIVQ